MGNTHQPKSTQRCPPLIKLAAGAAVIGMAMGDLATCTTSSAAYVTACVDDDNDLTTCPAGCQDAIDTMYSDCGGLEEGGVNWNDGNAALKTGLEAIGCSGAQHIAGSLFLMASAVVAQMFN